jgi:hypothetical protein
MAACGLSCAISAIFIIGMIYMNYQVDKSDIILKYKSKLPDELQRIYENINIAADTHFSSKTSKQLQLYADKNTFTGSVF